MAPPGNGIFVVRGEMATLMTAMKRGHRWSSSSASYPADEEQDGLLRQFTELKAILGHIEDLRLIEPIVFLAPFLDVIRSEETTGPITSLALGTVQKFLAYGLIDPTHPALATTVESIADAVTHARFVGTDQMQDAVVLMKIVQVLRTLMLSPEGSVLTNESVCEVMLSCFRICFEGRLSELLCQTAEHALRDIVLLLFMRLPQFAEERNVGGLVRRLRMMAGGSLEQKRRKSKVVASGNAAAAAAATAAGGRKSSTSTLGSADGVPAATRQPTDVASPTPATTTATTTTTAAAAATGLLAVPRPQILSTTPATPLGNIVDMQGKMMQTTPLSSLAAAESAGTAADETTPLVVEPVATNATADANNDADIEDAAIDDVEVVGGDATETTAAPATTTAAGTVQQREDFVNSMGVRFTPVSESEGGTAALVPYGLPCIRELLRFLVSLCNPLDKQNTDRMMHIGLSLLTVALEVGADHIGNYESLMALVKDDMCRNLFALLNLDRLSIFAADLQVCFLLFESLRSDLKFHLEFYMGRLFDIVAGEQARPAYEKRELALDNILQLCRIPGFAAELYINYDCNLYCSDLLENLVQLLSKNTLSASGAQQQLYSVHQMSLDGLLTVVKGIEKNCAAVRRIGSVSSTAGPLIAGSKAAASAGGRHSRNSSSTAGIVLAPLAAAAAGSENESSGVENCSNFSSVHAALAANKRQSAAKAVRDTPAALLETKNQKRILTQGTELFNQEPSKGIAFLQKNGLLQPQLDAMEVALFLRDNAGLDKAKIGEYISKKKNVELRILENFVVSFDFTQTRIDLALRQYLETFRLPGEAPLIFLVMEHFAEHWHKCNNEPFANADSAFRLAYAIIMLNMDQHNYNAKRLNIPMTAEDFAKNLRGLNGSVDFDQTMLAEIYNGIKTEEIIMPAEQTGLIRENYLWKVLLRRGLTKDARFAHVADATHDRQLFQIVWGPTLAAISYIFDKTPAHAYAADSAALPVGAASGSRALAGLSSGAVIAAHYSLHSHFDALILTLCKFSGLLGSAANTAAGSTGLGTDDPAHVQSASLYQPPSNPNADIATAVAFAQNTRAQLALQTCFGLLHEHADCMRDGWRPLLDVCVQLFRAKLLPRALTEVEDFCEPSGKVQLAAEKPPAKPADAGIFSSLYSYLASDGVGRQPTYEEQEYIKLARRCIRELHIERVISDTKFLQSEALHRLLAAFCGALRAPTAHKSLGGAYAEEVIVFQMELMVKVLVANRDRVLPVWQPCRDRMYQLVAGAASCGYPYLLTRATVAVLKLAIYLMRNEELCPAVLQSLRMLLALKPAVILATARPISLGIYELLKTSAQNIHTEADWEIVFTLLECVGAGAIPPEADEAMAAAMAAMTTASTATGAKSEGAVSSTEEEAGRAGSGGQAVLGSSDRGYTSDSELLQQQAAPGASESAGAGAAKPENWILVNKNRSNSGGSSGSEGGSANSSTASVGVGVTQVSCPGSPAATLTYPCRLLRHSPFALVKCWESLAFIVRNVAHITPYNFESCVKCIRTFVEASLSVPGAGGAARHIGPQRSAAAANRAARSRREQRDALDSGASGTGSEDGLAGGAGGEDGEAGSAADEHDDLMQRYELIAEQLLDLMHTLHTRTAQIFRWWAEEGGAANGAAQQAGLWAHGWCPLLQGIARLVNDRRREVRTHAIEYLQRALLVHDLQALSGPEWQQCFKQVIFPLLFDLLAESSPGVEAGLLDESRIRTATIMWKVFLHHLTPLIALPGFGELWLEILEYMERFMGVGSDMLHEAMREGLKNMLLVVNMHPVRVFYGNAALWQATWERIGKFMPQLKDELFRDKAGQNSAVGAAVSEALATSQPTPSNAPVAAAQEQVVQAPVQQQEVSALPQAAVAAEPTAAEAAQPHYQVTEQQQQQPLLQQQQQQHIPYLVSQAQQQFALMEQQYAQQYQQPQQQQQQQPQQQYHALANQFAVTLDMGTDSEPEFSTPQRREIIAPSSPVAEQQLPESSQPANIVYGSQFAQSEPAPADALFNDYVQNPYNLVALSGSQSANGSPFHAAAVEAAERTAGVEQSSAAAAPVANVFQSANYFGASNSDDLRNVEGGVDRIPPGSEMLFGSP